MLSSPPHKPSFEAFVQTCTPLLKIADLEAVMRQRVQEIEVQMLEEYLDQVTLGDCLEHLACLPSDSVEQRV